MDTDGVAMQGFAYGEDFDPLHGRSLGYRLLAPAAPEDWGAEVEALARRLQAAPYPESWPPVELFSSTLLAGGRRLVAVARYGLADHTPSHRRGGLELIGVVGPADQGPSAALRLYRWLRERRAESPGPQLGEAFGDLDDVLQHLPALEPLGDRLPVLPVRLWQ